MNNEYLTQFDAVDRPQILTDARGMTVEMLYSQALLQSRSLPSNQGSAGNRRNSQYFYDVPNRLTEIQSEVDLAQYQSRVGYAYSGFSQLRSLIRLMNGNPKNTQAYFDPLGRLARSLDFLARETQIAHAPFCVATQVTTPRGVQRLTNYDTLCRTT
ncbi:hypothetical protein IV102_37895, partial [bacterium]|nr:hypothetical protein [bacterium]